MPGFSYKAVDRNGKGAAGLLDAPSRMAAVRILRERGLTPFALKPATRIVAAQPRGLFRLRPRSVPKAAVAGMARQLSTLLQAGLPLDQALSGIVSGGDASVMRGIVEALREGILAGGDLADGLAAFPHAFSSTFVAMVRAGESSGTLNLVMERLARHLEQQVELQRKIRATLAYPVLMLVVGVGVVIFLLSFVIPQVTSMFAEMGRELPLPTRLLLAFSNGLRSGWWLLPGLIGGAGFGLWRLVRHPRGRRLVDGCLLRLPGIGGVYGPLLLGNMTRTLGMLLKNGVSLLKALVIVQSASDNLLMRQAVEDMINGVQAGRELSGFMKNPYLFSAMSRQMVAAGEKSGRLDDMLLWVAEDCESRVAARLHMFTALLEPVMILVLGSLVGFVVMAIMLPIFEMSTLAG